MQPQALALPDELRDIIQEVWCLTLDFRELPAGLEILPDSNPEIIFTFGSTCRLATADGWRPLPSPFLVGLLRQPVVVHAKSHVTVLGIRCFPWTVFELLGDQPAGPDGVRTIAHPIAHLQAPLAALVQAGRIAEALAQAQAFCLAMRARMSPDRLLDQAGLAMRAAHGTLSVSQVAAAAHATVRTLERKFKQAAGYTVKDVSGLMRFEQARDHLWLHPEANLAGLAQDLGYADQAHLSREFRRYSGTSPAAFARVIKHKQAVASSDFVAFLQA